MNERQQQIDYLLCDAIIPLIYYPSRRTKQSSTKLLQIVEQILNVSINPDAFKSVMLNKFECVVIQNQLYYYVKF